MDLTNLGNLPLDSGKFEWGFDRIKEEIGCFDTKNSREVKEKVNKANDLIYAEKTHLKFEIHEETHAIMIKIIESDTGDVLKEIPPEKLVDMIAEICKRAGLFIDKKV